MDDESSSRTPEVVRGLLAVAFVVLVVTGWVFLKEELTLASLVRWERELLSAYQSSPLAVAGAAAIIYIAVTGLSLPGATVLSLLYAWLLPFPVALMIVSLSSTAGATLAFLASRYLLSQFVRKRFYTQLQKIDAAFAAEGGWYLLTLRLIPAVPFFLINVGMGLTAIRVRTYVLVSWLGMLPGTTVYVFAGSQVPSLEQLAEQPVSEIVSWRMVLALSALALFPWLTRRGLRWIGSGKKKKNPPAGRATDGPVGGSGARSR